MDKEKATIETGEKKKGNETPDIIELPEKLKQEITSQSEKEAASFKKEGAEELAHFKNGEYEVDTEDKKELQELDLEADAAKKELLAEIGEKEWTPDSDFPSLLPDEDEPPLPEDDEKKWTPDSHFPPPIPKERGEKTKVCAKCGAEIASSAKFCTECGNKFEKENKKEVEAKNAESARKEIEELAKLESLEQKAEDFIESKGGSISDISSAEQYENSYAIPAFQQIEKLHGIIRGNKKDRTETKENEKSFNSISSILEDRKALCIHFLTGFSNANNKTTAFGVDSSKKILFSKRSKEASSQLKTLAALNPSLSASIFADSHNFESSWCRNSGQPIGVILREGECTEIYHSDAASQSQSPKRRSARLEPISMDQINSTLSEEHKSYTQSGYNEAVISEPRIGALFVTTNNFVSKECLKTLIKENDEFGYPILFENKGKFYELSEKEINDMMQEEGDEVWATEYFDDSREVTRDMIRDHISSFESDSLKDKEKKRFDEYVRNYELKPHFDWAEELETIIDTKEAFYLDQEINKIADYEDRMKKELETGGQLVERLTDYFEKNPQQGKHWVEEATYVDGEIFEGRKSQIPKDANVEKRKTEFWKYENDTKEPPILHEKIVGIGESLNFQKTTRQYLYVVKYPDGKVYSSASEKTAIISNSKNRSGDNNSREAYACYFEEATERNNEDLKRLEKNSEIDSYAYKAFRPLNNAIDYKDKGNIMEPGDLKNEMSSANYLNEERLRRISAYASAMAEISESNGDTDKATEWKDLAKSIEPNSSDRYEFVKSKLNGDGTLKLDDDDISKL